MYPKKKVLALNSVEINKNKTKLFKGNCNKCADVVKENMIYGGGGTEKQKIE